MFPVYLALVPLFFQVNNLHLLNTYQGLVLVYTAFSMPFTVFFLHSFFRTLPTETMAVAHSRHLRNSRLRFVMLDRGSNGGYEAYCHPFG